MALRLVNAGTRAVVVTAARVEPLSLAAAFDVTLVGLGRGLLAPGADASLVAHVTLRGGVGVAGALDGALVVHTNDTHPAFARVVVPLSAHVLVGALTLAPRCDALLRATRAVDAPSSSGTGASSSTLTMARLDDFDEYDEVDDESVDVGASNSSANGDGGDSRRSAGNVDLSATVSALLAAAPLRTIRLRNAFAVPLLLLAATLDGPLASVVAFEPRLIAPLAECDAVVVRFVAPVDARAPPPMLLLLTNASTLAVPLRLYDGRLTFALAQPPHLRQPAATQPVVRAVEHVLIRRANRRIASGATNASATNASVDR